MYNFERARRKANNFAKGKGACRLAPGAYVLRENKLVTETESTNFCPWPCKILRLRGPMAMMLGYVNKFHSHPGKHVDMD